MRFTLKVLIAVLATAAVTAFSAMRVVRFHSDFEAEAYLKLQAKKDALLAYLRAVGESDKYLSGQRRNGSPAHEEDWAKLEKETGKLPAILCAEYCTGAGEQNYNTAEEAMQWRAMNAVIQDHWKKGGLVTITFHFPNPYNENFNGLRQKIEDGGIAICTDGTPERARWLALLDEVVKGVKDLNDKGIIPELRPLHESNGAWFWWGSYLPPAVQQKLEDDFFKKVREALCVVVWHKSWSMSRDERVWKPKRYDIVGFDVYGESARELSSILQMYNEAVGAGKIFMLSEFGAQAAVMKNMKQTHPYDCMEIISQMDSNCPRSAGSVWWSGPWGMQSCENAKEYMNSPRVITREEVSYKGR